MSLLRSDISHGIGDLFSPHSYHACKFHIASYSHRIFVGTDVSS